MGGNGRTRVLVVVFDALRPEFVTPELMPNLHGFAARGVRYANSRSTFPTETRVNQSAVITGCRPTRHGIVANRFPEPTLAPGHVLDTGKDEQLEAVLAAHDPALLEMPSLGERLNRAGLTFATLSTGTSGGGRLINHKAEAHGDFRLALKRPEAAAPTGVMARVTERIGPLPEYTLPALDWVDYGVACYLDYIEPEFAPDAMLLWLSEPDESFHHLGIGAPGALKAIAHVDTAFGRILKAHERAIASGALQVIAMSDHGQIALEGVPLDLPARLSEAGLPTAATPDPTADCVVVAGNAGGLWVRDRDPDLIARIVAWLRRQSWCGPLFTREPLSGTLALHEIGLDHARAPDIALALSHTDAANAFGRAGLSLHDSIYPAGGGCHGGLSAYELHNVLTMAGSAFREGAVIETPAGTIDIAPTVLTLLGLEHPAGLDGRILDEALASPSGTPPAEPVTQTLRSDNADGPVTHLSLSEVGTTRYLNVAWTE